MTNIEVYYYMEGVQVYVVPNAKIESFLKGCNKDSKRTKTQHSLTFSLLTALQRLQSNGSRIHPKGRDKKGIAWSNISTSNSSEVMRISDTIFMVFSQSH